MKYSPHSQLSWLLVLTVLFVLAGGSVGQEMSSSGNKPLSNALADIRGGEVAEPNSALFGLQVKEVPASLGQSVPIEPVQTIAPLFLENSDGMFLKEAPLNEVFQYLAQEASLQFFHNVTLNGPQYMVTGQLMNHLDPLRQMEELGLMYGVSIHQKGRTVYALTSAQESVLPAKPNHYQLRYLRASDIDQIKTMLEPFLTPGSGFVQYESKTNTVVIYDNDKKAGQLMELLCTLDQPKQQVAIETRILRVKSNSRNRVGVDWSSILGDGVSISASASLNHLFNLPTLDTVTRVLTSSSSGNSFEHNRNQTLDGNMLVLSPLQMTAVMKVLNSGGLAQQESSPTLITEDNEEGLISVIDRVPIIVNTISETEVGQNISEDVRYKIDPDDPYGDPATTREIGVSVAVTPTILPDNTIRMKLRPRSSQIVEFVQSRSGNLFPRVNESTVTTLARVPNGHSLLIGGFYEEIESDNSEKVPVVGDIPGLNFMFKNDDKSKEHTSLVFIVTPSLYSPANACESDATTSTIGEMHVLPQDYDYPDAERPGYNHKRSLKNSMAALKKSSRPADPPSSPLVPHTTVVEYPPSVQAKPVLKRGKGNGQLFKKLFGKK